VWYITSAAICGKKGAEVDNQATAVPVMSRAEWLAAMVDEGRIGIAWDGPHDTEPLEYYWEDGCLWLIKRQANSRNRSAAVVKEPPQKRKFYTVTPNSPVLVWPETQK